MKDDSGLGLILGAMTVMIIIIVVAFAILIGVKNG